MLGFRRVVFLLSCFFGLSAFGADVEFLRVWPAWRTDESFERIGEYFGRPENTGREIVLRTEPTQRAGYYFLVRVKSATALPGAKFTLSVIRPDHPEPNEFSFPASLAAKETVFQLGLTGKAWPGGSEAHPVAWKLALVSAEGGVLAEYKSFLWEKPAR